MTTQCENYGLSEPCGYLAVWQEAGHDLSQAAHSDKNFPVPLASVKTWLEDNGHKAILDAERLLRIDEPNEQPIL